MFHSHEFAAIALPAASDGSSFITKVRTSGTTRLESGVRVTRVPSEETSTARAMAPWLVDVSVKVVSVRLAGSMLSEKVSSIGSFTLTSEPGVGVTDTRSVWFGHRDLHGVAVGVITVGAGSMV